MIWIIIPIRYVQSCSDSLPLPPPKKKSISVDNARSVRLQVLTSSYAFHMKCRSVLLVSHLSSKVDSLLLSANLSKRFDNNSSIQWLSSTMTVEPHRAIISLDVCITRNITTNQWLSLAFQIILIESYTSIDLSLTNAFSAAIASIVMLFVVTADFLVCLLFFFFLAAQRVLMHSFDGVKWTNLCKYPHQPHWSFYWWGLHSQHIDSAPYSSYQIW